MSPHNEAIDRGLALLPELKKRVELQKNLMEFYEVDTSEEVKTLQTIIAALEAMPPLVEGSVVNPSSADDLRDMGLSVAVHNDYRLNGKRHTFWLFTRADGMSFKGEGPTDASALNEVRFNAKQSLKEAGYLSAAPGAGGEIVERVIADLKAKGWRPPPKSRRLKSAEIAKLAGKPVNAFKTMAGKNMKRFKS